MIDPTEILRQRFSLTEFRKGQKEVIDSVLAGQDTLAVMPTGSGKSLCYQLPALCREGIVVVVSPLIALMEDQVRGLKNLGIPAGFVHSNQTYEEKQALFRDLRAEKNFVLYLSPERVQKDGFADWVRKNPIQLFAIDESHCISQWGPDFRTDYHRLTLLRELRQDVPILALTATATPMVLKDIAAKLKLRDPSRHVYGFYRENLYLQVEQCDSDERKLEVIEAAVRGVPEGRVLIYCGTRKTTQAIQEALSRRMPGVGYYHAGLDADERTRVQKDYDSGATRILAATNAFGMGIDHPDVRLVIHHQIPANLEGYYQEMGRAGRDGKNSTCLLLYGKRDKSLHAFFIEKSEADEETKSRRWRALRTILDFAEGGGCRHAGILTYFRDTFRLKACGHCDTCRPESNRRVIPGATEVVVKIKKKKKRGGAGAVAEPSAGGPLSGDEVLRADLLRGWRREYADSHDVPAFVVFSDRTLHDLARRNPSTTDELAAVYGFGPHKVTHLGPHVLEVLRQSR